ncbi:PIGN family protein [Megaselia abdita]
MIIQAVFIHIALLGSIFVIYFRSPVITGLTPIRNNEEKAPAKRLVLLVTDGLRSQSFFENDCQHIPKIKELFLENGLLGISQTRVPTESRPGHIALIAGLYEDPSAVTRGWKDNPIDFDTVFNRSSMTYAFGAHDVLSIFSKITTDGRMLIDSYDHELDFSGSVKTFMLDTWVFNKTKQLLDRKREELQDQQKLVFFLHLLGLDSAGHIHKPGTPDFYENLHITDEGVSDIYEYFENIFPDGKTAYVLTSDHGMTDSGSHGSGGIEETSTPLFIWGSGVKNWHSLDNHSYETVRISKIEVPLFQVEQAQIAPLMSALIGQSPPVNNFGKLPINLLNVSLAYQAESLSINAFQILSQYEMLIDQFESGFFSKILSTFEPLTKEKVSEFHKTVDHLLKERSFEKVIEISEETIEKSLDGIEYFQTYYKNVLLFSTVMTFLGWIFYLLQVLKEDLVFKAQPLITKLFLWSSLPLVIIVLQKIPLGVAFYMILPIVIWVAVGENFTVLMKNVRTFEIQTFLLLLFGCEIVVLSFFQKEFISLAFVALSLKRTNLSHFTSVYQKLHFVLVYALLLLFPLFALKETNKSIIFLIVGVCFTLLRTDMYKIKDGVKKFTVFTIVNMTVCIYLHSNKIQIPSIIYLISWFNLICNLFIPIYVTPAQDQTRIYHIIHSLKMVFMTFSISYEVIFLEMFSSFLVNFVKKGNSREIKENSFITALSILIFTFYSFYSTGNTASVSSFNPSIVRCYFSTFSPFTIMFLVILKLVIPVVITVTIFFGLSKPQLNERNVYIWLLVICNVLGINFLFFVKNKGSWLEIGSSISHFVIMEVTTLVLVLISLLAKFLINVHFNGKRNDD